ncbi:MAG: LysR substrate-binding domain-containing protein [Mesorhizobium sp.]|nr:LysR substrate-binding domain-containing protein [Mesorhizobium sp.]
MLRETPNLDWLRVFAETAATESFVEAAARLSVTPGAVSQRIKALESFLRVELFQRYPQGVKLTEAGRRYAKRISPALDLLLSATREIASTGGPKTVRITILPALAQLWLGPKMDDFYSHHANTNIEIWADATVIDMRTSNFDIAIRYGQPPFPGCEHRALLFDELVPVASPKLVSATNADHIGLPTGAPLMLDIYWEHDFTDWLNRTSQIRPEKLSTQTFSLYSMTVDAAVQGSGFMVGHTALIGGLLREGRLQQLSDLRVPSNNQFYLLTKSGTPLSEAAESFVAWVLGQAKTSETGQPEDVPTLESDGFPNGILNSTS